MSEDAKLARDLEARRNAVALVRAMVTGDGSTWRTLVQSIEHRGDVMPAVLELAALLAITAARTNNVEPVVLIDALALNLAGTVA